MDLELLARRVRDRFVTLQGMVENSLRRAILEDKVHAGQKMTLLTLATAFGVSPVPVRETLRKLEAEGLVVSSPHRGWFIAPLSGEELEELYAMRVGLEMLAARLGALRMNTEFLGRMKRAFHRMSEIAKKGKNLGTFLEVDLEFHSAHYLASGRTRLWERIFQLRQSSQRYIRQYWEQPGGMTRTLLSHRKILEACTAQDGKSAAAIVRRDLELTARDLLALLRRRQTQLPLLSVSKDA